LKRRNSNPTGRTDGPRKGATKLKLLHHAQGRNPKHGRIAQKLGKFTLRSSLLERISTPC
jgi:hypothetical protein